MVGTLALQRKITMVALGEHKAAGEKFAMLTCCDATMARIQQEAGAIPPKSWPL